MSVQNSLENPIREKAKGLCSACNQPGKKICSSCREGTYCSRECQVKDWPEHKKTCSPSVISFSEDLGRHLIANRDMKAGDLIVTEKPTICAPSNQKQNPFVPPCLSCFEPTPDKCSKCLWPICSSKCEKVKHHADNECNIVSKYSLEYDFSDESDDMQVLRMCLVKEKNPELWEKILNLQYESNIPSALNEAATDVLEEKGNIAREKFKLTDQITSEEWIRMHRTSRISGFLIDLSKAKSEIDKMGSFLFLKSSMFSHACSPNCYYEVSAAPQFRITVRAAVDIQKGTILTILYNASTKLCGTFKRQRDLLKSAGFLCKCTRCSDKTELGSYVSALICFVCKNVILPNEPLNPNTTWGCMGPRCGIVLSADQVKMVTKQMRRDIKRFIDMDCYTRLCSEIEKSKDVLHPNHWILIGAYRSVLAILSSIISRTGGTPDQKRDYFNFGVKMLSILEMVTPGISHQTAGLKMSLSALALEYIQLKMESNVINLVQFNIEMQSISKWQTDAFLYFKNETTVHEGVTVYGPNAQSLLECIQYQEDVKRRYNSSS